MGKTEEEQTLAPPAAISEGSEENAAPSRCWIWRSVRFRCVAALVLGVAVLLSAIFWLPPFLNGDRERHEHYGDIVASFKLQRSVSLLQDNIVNLENDILGEIGVANSTVLIESLEPVAGSNWTNVVFGVWPYEKNSTISSTGLSILRSYFMSFLVHQPDLHLSQLFGDPSFFQVLKFPGGITVIPPQSGFPLQKGPIIFNFTLNFCIYQIQGIFDELQYQLKSGLHLTPYENLYIKLTNLHGSTVDPPIIVQASVLLAVRDLRRLRQLVQDIKGSPARNLGLNHTVFGKVKQIRLSSSFDNTVNGGNGGSISSSPSPAPSPRPNHRKHHHHHHHQHHLPDVHPTPAPAPQHSYRSPSPSPCQFQFPKDPSAGSSIPTVAPMVSPHPSFASPPLDGDLDPPAPVSDSPSPSSPPLSSPLPAVVLGHSQPPSKTTAHIEPPNATPSVSPLPSSSFGAGIPAVQSSLSTCMLLLSLLMHL